MKLFATLALVLLAWCCSAPAAARRTVSAVLVLTGEGDRGTIRYRVTAPVAGRRLPLLLFSHGAGYSGDDYAPLATWWAARGFVVVQPTNLDARALALPVDDPRRATLWRSRRDDLVAVLDRWPALREQWRPVLGRADPTRVLAAGHSFGGHSAALLGGMTVRGSPSLADARVLGLVLMSPPGGYDGLADAWKVRAPYLDADWSGLRIPTLTLVGSLDRSAMSPRDADWHADAYRRASGAGQCLITFTDVGHFLGGIGGQPLTAPADPPAPVATRAVQSVSADFLRMIALGTRRGTPALRQRLTRLARGGDVECR